jgi:hypothetical protein
VDLLRPLGCLLVIALAGLVVLLILATTVIEPPSRWTPAAYQFASLSKAVG